MSQLPPVVSTYSQHGEEAVLLALLRASWPRTLVEVGAHDGVGLSNSRLLIEAFGFSGVLIEPMPAPFARLAAVYADNPAVTCLNLAIADTVGDGVLFVGSDGPEGTMSTLCQDENAWFAAHRTQDRVTVAVDRLTDVLDRQKIDGDIGLLLVDAEGMDYEVLRSLDFARYTPRVVVTENYVHNPQKHIAKFDLLLAEGYALIQQVGANTIWLRRDLLAAPRELSLLDLAEALSAPEGPGRPQRHRQFHIVDPALEDGRGHHFHFDLTLAQAAWRLGYRPRIWGNRRAEWTGFPDHVAVEPFFPFHHGRGIRIVGAEWSQPFEDEAELFRLQLGGWPAGMPTAGDVLFCHSLLAPQMLGLAAWLQTAGLPADVTVIVFPISPDFLDPARGQAYRAAFAGIAASGARLIVCAETAALCEALSALLPPDAPARIAPLLLPVVDLPLPPLPDADRPPRIAFLGDAGRASKGAGLLPGIFDALTRDYQGPMEAFLSVASADPALVSRAGVTLSTAALSSAEYCRRLMEADILLMPYDPDYYRTIGSGIAFEGALAGKAMVIPANTAMAAMLESLGAAVYPFAEWTAEAVAAALAEACRTARDRMPAARSAAERLRAERGPASWLRQVLPAVAESAPMAPIVAEPGDTDALLAEITALRAERTALLSSTSWRLTAPLRAMIGRMRGR